MMFAKWISCCLLLIVLQGCENNAPLGAKQPSEVAWISFKSPDAPYSVSLPFQPTMKVLPGDGGAKMNFYQCADPEGATLVTAAYPFQGEVVITNDERCQKLFDQKMKRVYADKDYRDVENTKVLLDGKYPGLDISAKMIGEGIPPGAFHRERIILTDRYIIQLQVIGNAQRIKSNEVNMFFDSIKFTN